MKSRNFLRTAMTVSAAAMMCASPAAAQSYQHLRGHGASEVRITAGIVIPLGGSTQQAKSKPRADFGFDQRDQRTDVLLPANPLRARENPQWRRTRIALTMEDNPRMLMNGAEVARFNLATHADEDDNDDKKSGSVSPWLIGGGVLLAVVVVAAASNFNDLSPNQN